MLGRIFALTALGLGISACGSTVASSPPVTTTRANATTTTVAQTTTTAAGPGKLGTAYSMRDQAGDDVDVEVYRVIDPASPTSVVFAAPSGQRLVGVQIGVVNQSRTPFTDDMNNDVTVIGSDSQTYTAVVNGITECTNFDYGTVDLVKGATAAGCVAFSLPDGVTVAQVDFKPGADFSGAPAEWAG